jgi:nucleotide-binding universal stress UspA family protein
MFKKMLVPLDGSKLAEVVFTYAKELAGRLDMDDVTLLNVCMPEEREFRPMHEAYVEHSAEIVKHDAQKLRKGNGAGKIEAKGAIAVGYPAEEILRYAEAHQSDIILMATHGRSGVQRWTVGSIADKVLRASSVPVLLVRSGLPNDIVYNKWPNPSILVPLDGSELAEVVLPHVENLVKQHGPENMTIVLVRVCEPPATPTYYSPELAEVPLNWGQYIQQEMTKCRQQSTQYLDQIAARFEKLGVRQIKKEILAGRASDVIVDYINKNPSNMVVMATHGRSGWSRFVYGSVAESILMGVNSPILLIRAPQPEPAKK